MHADCASHNNYRLYVYGWPFSHMFKNIVSRISLTNVKLLPISLIKTHGRVSAAKKDVRHTSVLFTGTAKSPFSTPHIFITTGPISIKFTYFIPSIKTHGRMSAAKKDVQYTKVLFTRTIKSPFSTSYISITTGLIPIKFTYFIPSICTTSHMKFE